MSYIAYLRLLDFAQAGRAVGNIAAFEDAMRRIVAGEMQIVGESGEEISIGVTVRRLALEVVGAARYDLEEAIEHLVRESFNQLRSSNSPDWEDSNKETMAARCLEIAEVAFPDGALGTSAQDFAMQVLEQPGAAYPRLRSAAFLALVALDRGLIESAAHWRLLATGIEPRVMSALLFIMIKRFPDDAPKQFGVLVRSPDNLIRKAATEALKTLREEIRTQQSEAYLRRLARIAYPASYADRRAEHDKAVATSVEVERPPELGRLANQRSPTAEEQRIASLVERAEQVIRDVALDYSWDLKTLNYSDKFMDDLGADSLDVVQLIIAFEVEFGIVIPPEVPDRILTVGDAVDYILKNT